MFICKQCGYNTKIKCNFIRHLTTCKMLIKNTKNEGQNNNPEGQNNNPEGQNNNPEGQNNNPPGQNNNPEHKCSKCSKILKSHKRLLSHSISCTGVNSLQCKTCMRMFTTQQGKWKHNERVNCARTPPSSSSVTTNNQIQNQYNGPVTIDNSVHNNVTIQLNIHGNENYHMLLDTIRTKYPKAFLNMVRDGDTASLLRLVHFNSDFPENQTIRKRAKKDVSAEVHIGEGQWEKRPTQQLIDSFRGETRKRVFGSIDEKLSVDIGSQSDLYIREVMYEQSKYPNGNTDSLLKPFSRSDHEDAEMELMRCVNRVKSKLTKEYPSLTSTKMFTSLLKSEMLPIVHAFEKKWNTIVQTDRWK